MMTALLDSTDVSMTAKSASAILTSNGAIAIVTGEPRPILIGDLQWSEGRELFIFTAFGDAATDAHRIQFEEALVHDNGNVTFMSGGHVAATILRIEDADIDDPDDYRIAYQLWRDVAALYRPLIERSYDALQPPGGD